jgi:hypothetical protein
MSATAPPIQSLKDFKKKTTPFNLVRRGRGKRLKLVDAWLEAWEQNLGATHAHKATILSHTLTAIRDWLRAKEGKDSSTTNFRMPTVLELANQVFARLQYETFEANKANPVRQTNTRSLQGTYRHERTTYEQTNKQHAYSATTAQALLRNRASLFGPAVPQHYNFDTISDQDFTNLIQTYATANNFEPEVLFLNKQNRLKQMIIIENGKFYDGPTSLFDTSSNRKGFAYAIDEYGDLFTADDGVNSIAHLLSDQRRFNHSTLNAGKDVICAGVLKVNHGRLTFIDNGSGHYKPTRNNLLNALRLLQNLGVDLQNVEVACLEPSMLHRGQNMYHVHHNVCGQSSPKAGGDRLGVRRPFWRRPPVEFLA